VFNEAYCIFKEKSPIKQPITAAKVNEEQTFVKPKKTNNTSCLTIKLVTIDSA
jgi:hypothetical protein